MTKAQWKAIYDYCEDNGYKNPRELLTALKAANSVDKAASVEELDLYVEGTGYDDMQAFLTGELG